MPINIQISKRSTIELPDISSYKLTVDAVSSEGMTDKIFVKQRIRNFATGAIEDTFVAVCTPAQLEDFEEDAPYPGTSYYRTNSIEVIARTPELLQNVFESLMYEVQKLVEDLTDLENLSEATTYNVTALGPVTELFEAPVITHVIGANEQLSIFFLPPASIPEGDAVVSYEYSVDGGNFWWNRYAMNTAEATTSPLIIPNLINGSVYDVRLRAVSSTRMISAASEQLFCHTLTTPEAPQITGATTGDGTINVGFIPPATSIGGLYAMNYEYSTDNGATWIVRSPASNLSPVVITGLLNDTEYTIKLRAVNSAGYVSLPSSVVATPSATV